MENITILNRTFRIALSLGLIFVTLNMSGPLGTVVYALFISIYAGITASIGWDPLIALMGSIDKKSSLKLVHGHHSGLVAH